MLILLILTTVLAVGGWAAFWAAQDQVRGVVAERDYHRDRRRADLRAAMAAHPAGKGLPRIRLAGEVVDFSGHFPAQMAAIRQHRPWPPSDLTLVLDEVTEEVTER